MESPEISYLLSLPDDVLIYRIFPQYDVSYLIHLCEINTRFNIIICQNDKLWHILTNRDFGFDVIPQGFNNWKDVYIFHNYIFTHPHDAIPYVEAILLQRRAGGNISLFEQKLLRKYIKDYSYISYKDGSRAIIHMIELYDPISNTFIPAKSLDQVKILRSNENMWRYLSSQEKDWFKYHAKNIYIKYFDPSIFV
jgi:hypothetical protein